MLSLWKTPSISGSSRRQTNKQGEIMRPTTLKNTIKFAIKNNLPGLIKGAPGVGKSDIVAQACREANAELIVSHPVVSDPTDYKGLPFPDKEGREAHFLPFGELNKLINADKLTVFFLDDLGQAPMSVQAACFPANTKVSVPNGTANIEDLVVGDTIIDGYGNQQKVTWTFVNKTDRLVKINAVGILPIVSTEDHPILVSSGRKRSYKKGSDGKYNMSSVKYGEAKWINASMVKPNDYIALPIPKPYITNHELTISTNGTVKRTVPLTEELSELCGYYVGDGWYTQHKNVQSVAFALDNKYPEIQERLIYLIEKVFGAKAFVQTYTSHKRIQFHDKEIGEFFNTHMGNRSNNKHVPEWIVFNEDINIVTSFIKGYYYTDGADLRSSGVRRGVQFSTVSKTLALQVQQMMLRYNTVAPIKYHCKKGQVMKSPRDGKEYSVQDAYVIQCSSKTLLDALGVEYDKKRDVEWSYEHDGMMWTRVKSVSYTDAQCDTYNIEVSGSNTYSVNNVCVHNCMQLILARRINGFKISDKVIFMAATNRREDKAGVTGILEPVKSRFAWIVELVPSLDDWIDWAVENDMPHQLISFIKWRPQLLLDFNPTSDIINSPCPRTIAHVGRILNGNPPEDVRSELIEGAVGAGFAAEFEAFVNIYTKLPSLDDMIKNPTNIAIPEQPDMLYALCGLVAYGINEHNLSNLLKLIKRIPEEYQTMIMSVALAKAKKDKKDFIRHNSDFALWAKNMMNVLLTNNGR